LRSVAGDRTMMEIASRDEDVDGTKSVFRADKKPV
jgi:hypothetical protein